MIIAGIDPGVQRAGYAILEIRDGRPLVRDLGVWNLLSLERENERLKRASLGARLEFLHQELNAFFGLWNPSLIGLEKAVSFRNVASAHKLSEARGVVRLAAHQLLSKAEERLIELSPTAVKRQAAGFGASSKQGVSKSLSLRFSGLKDVVGDRKLPFDAFDALAIAWTAWVIAKADPSRRALRKARSLDL
jgi:Holliday junction resolvasome RuvABC endonuclease subunit